MSSLLPHRLLLLLLLLLRLQSGDKAMRLSYACRISSPSLISVPLSFQPRSSLFHVRLQSVVSSSKERRPIEKEGFFRDEAARNASSSLLYLLGGREQSESVDPSLAHQIWPYLRFLASPELQTRRKTSSFLNLDVKRFREILSPKNRKLVDQLIIWPPSAVAEISRKAVEWNGEKSVVLNSLNEMRYPVPDIEGASENHCQLTKYPYGHRFKQKELNAYFAFLFEVIAELAPSVGFNVSLNRFDLFHGHLFLAHNTGRLGILFHAREYPAFNEDTFPVHLGYCQVGSSVPYDDSMNFRNILWLAPMPDCSSNGTQEGRWLSSGSLLVLDAHPDGIIYKEFVPEYVDIVRTIYEDDFGDVVVDLNYFSTHDNPEDRLFVC